MQIIEIFINELSWDDKNFNQQNISQEMSLFRQILSTITQKRKTYKNLELFINLAGLKVENGFFDTLDLYEEELNRQTVQSIKQTIIKAKDWHDKASKRQLGQDNFYYLNLQNAKLELVNGTSLAEIAHRKIAQATKQFLVINFSKSRFQTDDFVSIIKQTCSNLPKLVHLTQIDTLNALKKWFRVEIDLKSVIDNELKFEEVKQLLYKSDFDFDEWNPTKKYLPLVHVSNILVEENWDTFREELSKKPQDKIAKISLMAKQVAIINGYDYNQQVSDLNKNTGQRREVYSAGKKRDVIYLSVDFETGGYEVCDYSGTHLGEYWFDGSQTQAAKPNTHSLKLS